MASPSSIQLIDAALSCTGPFALSYTDPDQKWLIRGHLISLLQDFPSLNPSIDTFIHNDGTTVNLLKANGDLHVSQSSIAVPLTIWLHENYPHMAPLVYVSSKSIYPIRRDHPFVDPSGATASPYLQTWLYPRCNLSVLVHNLAKLFSHNHPLCFSPASTFAHPSLVSKMEAMDRLACYLHHDMVALRAKTEEEVEGLSVVQAELVKRDNITSSMIIGLEHERLSLKQRVMGLMEEADILMNWLKIHDKNSVNVVLGGDEFEDAFEGVDDESKLVLDYLAADRAIEDLIDELDEAVKQGVVTFEMYIRQGTNATSRICWSLWSLSAHLDVIQPLYLRRNSGGLHRIRLSK
ncbi:hypothetical protein F0562_002493 [Nyssa sinensis]|uniref:UEV domain-containing protein n=1 Tax=Nyssa sinensis TaxID=561372 RepID=A0A5J5C6L5_9ASTE|nr:hypothetical protein F0562_002493 [Nyssa sinensis]